MQSWPCYSAALLSMCWVQLLVLLGFVLGLLCGSHLSVSLLGQSLQVQVGWEMVGINAQVFLQRPNGHLLSACLLEFSALTATKPTRRSHNQGTRDPSMGHRFTVGFTVAATDCSAASAAARAGVRVRVSCRSQWRASVFSHACAHVLCGRVTQPRSLDVFRLHLSSYSLLRNLQLVNVNEITLCGL
jgi:hypothetical protein